MKNFFLSDTALITTLRFLSWLGPCPEFSCVLLDWSRWNRPTKAGGLPAVLLPIFDHISRGNLPAAKKLAFAQQLISGVPDSGAWGGEALSDTEIRVRARNAECVRVLRGFLDEHDQNVRRRESNKVSTAMSKQRNVEESVATLQPLNNDNELKVAILYGAYHIEDLSTKLKNMGLKAESVSSLTAWNMDYPVKSTATLQPPSTSSPITSAMSDLSGAGSKSLKRSKSSIFGIKSMVQLLKTVRRPLLTIGVAGVCTTYLVLGALDWYVLIDFLVEVGENIFKSSTDDRGSAILGYIQRLFELNNNSSLNENDKILELSIAVIYFVAYVQRHLFALRTASTVGVQWDRGLFEDSLDK